MKKFSLLFLVVFPGFSASFCAQPTGEDVLRKKPDHTPQELRVRASRSKEPLLSSAFSPIVSRESVDEKQLQKGAVVSPSGDGSRGLTNDGDNDAAGKGGEEKSRDEVPDLSLHEKVKVAMVQGGLLGGSRTHGTTSTGDTIVESGTHGRLDSLDSGMSISDKDGAAVQDRLVSSFGDTIEAVMQSLVSADVFSAFRHFKDVFAPDNFAGPRVTTRLDDSSCILEVNLEHLPETALLRVSVEGNQVFVEYANSSQEISVEQETDSNENQPAEDEMGKRGSGMFGATSSPGYSLGRADVFSLESFQVPRDCDHESGVAKAARVDRDKLLIKFPRAKRRGSVELPSPVANSKSSAAERNNALPRSAGDFQKSYTDGKDSTSEPESTWTAELPFARRFMRESGRPNTVGKPADIGRLSLDKPTDEKKASAERTARRRYIPLVQADAL